MTQRAYRLPAPLATGYRLDANWAVVVPPTVPIINAVANPSVETNTTGYTAIGGTVAQSIAKQRRGAYSLRVTPGAGTADGFYYGTVATAAAAAYPWSFDIWAEAGREYLAYWASTAGAQVSAAVKIIGKGRWERAKVPYGETATTTRRLYVVKNGSANVRPFYIDGMLVPSGAGDIEDWRYFDGDTRGFVSSATEFYWNGTPHGSTSTMKAGSRAGGRILSLARYGFVLQAMFGLGMPTPNNVALPLALPGGEQYQRTLAPASDFQLVGYVEGNGLPDMQEKHNGLKAALDVRRQAVTQTLLLQYQPIDECGDVIGETAEVRCSFQGGLEGTWDNHYRENLNLKFRVHLPYIAAKGGTVAAALDVRDSFTAGYIARRDVNGIWGALNTSGLNAVAGPILAMPDGRWLLGGSFTNAGGVADADYLAYYDPTTDTFTAVNATPLNAVVQNLLRLPDGNVVVAGNFTNAGGFANADYLCLLTVATGAFSAFNATPLNNPVYALALLPTNDVAFGGIFTDAGRPYLGKLTLSTGAYSAFTVATLNGSVITLLTTSWGDLFIGGTFTDAGGFANNDRLSLLRAPYTVHSQLSGFTALNNNVYSLSQLSSGEILIGGTYTDVNGDTTWDYLISAIVAPSGGTGSAVPLMVSKPFSSINAGVFFAQEVRPGINIVGGLFSSVAGVPLFDALFQYSGSTIIPIDLDLPGAASVFALASRPNGELIVGVTTTGTAYTSGTTSITNPGSAPVRPVIVITHPTTATAIAPLYSIRNLTTGKVISFNLSLLIGETVTIDFAAGTITSDLRGSLNGTVLPGSNLDTFVLVPGPNSINIFSSLASGSLPSAYLWFVPVASGVADFSP